MSTGEMWVVAYDVVNDGRRQRVANALARHGDRVQRSVFIVRLAPGGSRVLAAQVGAIIDPATDSVHLVPQCGRCEGSIIELGQAIIPPAADCWVVL